MKTNTLEYIIHRGSHQIGGNCVELATRNTRILIDCGLPLDYNEQDHEIQEKIHEDAQEWLHHCDAIFLSHYHADHYGLLNEAPKGTKVYTSKETAELMKLSGIFGEDLTKHLDIQPIEGTVKVKDFRVTKYDVDHSAFGACAFLFEVDGKTILYSGDIRLHGKKGGLYTELPQNVDYLFLEGTNLGRNVKQKTEDDVRDEFIQQFNSNPDNSFLVWCSGQNIDRIVSLYKACLRTKRSLCIDPYTAYILNLAHQCHDGIPCTKEYTNLLVYYPSRFCTKLNRKRPDIHKEIVENSKKILNDDPQKNPSKYVFVFRPNLLDFFNRHLANTSIRFILSMWSQYWEKETPDLMRFKAWMDAEPELRKRLPDIHTSGHADMESLKQIVEHIQPKDIIPIHTEHSESFSTLFLNNNVMDVADEVRYSMIDPSIWRSTKSFEDLELGFYMTHILPKFSSIVITAFFKNPGVSPRIMLTDDARWSEWTDERTVSITLSTNPVVIESDENEIPAKVIEKAKEWVILNYEMLMRHWNGEIDSKELLNNIKEV